MARPTLRGHRKFRRLVRLLGVPEPYALGLLEYVWSPAYDSGDDVIGDVTDVEASALWTGEPGALVRALIDSGGNGHAGFLDEVPEHPGFFRIHDFLVHCPNYVKERAEREAERNAKGITISDIRREAGRKGGEASGSKRAANRSKREANAKQVADTPAPAPAPVGEENTPPTPRKRGGASAYSDEFEMAFREYPRHKAKASAFKAWLRLSPNDRAAAKAGIPQYVRYVAGSPEDKIAHFATWLTGRRWEDEPDGRPATAKKYVTGGFAPPPEPKS